MIKITRIISVEHLEDIEKIIFIVECEDGRQRSLGIETWGRVGEGLEALILKGGGEICLKAAKAAGIA